MPPSLPCPGQRIRSHIVLHDLNAVIILELDPGDFIESDTIPKADKSHCLPSHVVEKISAVV